MRCATLCAKRELWGVIFGVLAGLSLPGPAQGSLILYYSFEGNVSSGGTVVNQANPGTYNGTLQGDAYTNGVLNLDGDGDWLATTLPTNDLTGPVTFSFLMNASQVRKSPTLSGNDGSGHVNRWDIQLSRDDDQKIRFIFHADKNDPNYRGPVSTTTIAANTWYHVAVVVAPGSGGADGTAKIYVNGNLEASSSIRRSLATGINMMVGKGDGSNFAGQLDDLRIYNQALTDREILELQTFRVDFGRGDAGPNGPIQPGYFTFEAPGSTTSQTQEFISGLGQNGMVKVTISGNTHYRDYAAITSGPFVDLSPLLSDTVLRNAYGTMQLKLENLRPGWYWMTTYHHSTQFGGGTMDVQLTDLDGTRLIADDLLVTHGTEPTSISTLTFLVKTTGGPVLLEFIGGSANQHVSLNGFEMWVWVPEPASGTLALLGLAGVGLGLAGRRLRNRQKGSY